MTESTPLALSMQLAALKNASHTSRSIPKSPFSPTIEEVENVPRLPIDPMLASLGCNTWVCVHHAAVNFPVLGVPVPTPWKVFKSVPSLSPAPLALSAHAPAQP